MDALTNYISALGFGSAEHERLEHYWPPDIHLLGKDIVRFHAVYWPAFLMAAGVELPKSVVGHGWWLRDNQKISKSLGNVVRPYNILDDFGADALRDYVLREMVFGQDQNYPDEALLTRYNADLANDLGNTLSRAVKMSDSYFGGKTPPVSCDDNDLKRTAEARSRVIWNALEATRLVWVIIAPSPPTSAGKALERIGANPSAIGRESLAWGGLPPGTRVQATDPSFPRVDISEYIGRTMTETKEPNPETTQAAAPDAVRISIEQFKEVDLRVADVRAAERVPKSKKLLKLTVFTGEDERTIVAGIGTKYRSEELVGRKIIIVATLQPAKLMGVESNGMGLAAELNGEPSLLSVDPATPAGTKVR